MKSFLGIILLVSLITSCKPKSETMNETMKKGTEITDLNFIHTVFFWLKEDVTAEQRKTFETGMHDLGKVKTIGKYFIATPADTDRDVIDSSYDYAWIAHFANGADQASYQSDSLHLEFIEKYNSLWEKVQVYDSEVIGRNE